LPLNCLTYFLSCSCFHLYFHLRKNTAPTTGIPSAINAHLTHLLFPVILYLFSVVHPLLKTLLAYTMRISLHSVTLFLPNASATVNTNNSHRLAYLFSCSFFHRYLHLRKSRFNAHKVAVNILLKNGVAFAGMICLGLFRSQLYRFDLANSSLRVL
jgi:hypothetical protein